MRKLVLLLLVLAVPSSAADSFAYIYNRGGGVTHIRSNGNDIETMVELSKRWTGEYVWLKRAGRQYLIRDALVLAEVRAAFAELHAFEPKVRAAEERLRPLEERMDYLSDTLGDDDEERLANRDDLKRQLRKLRPRYEAAERETERLEREHERIEKVSEARFEKIVLRAVRDGKAQLVK